MATKKISELINVTSVQDTDLLMIENAEGKTRSVNKRNLLSSILSVDYASSSGNSDTVDGYHVNTALNNSSLKPISAGTNDMVAGTTELSQGNIYIVYE